MKKLMYVLSLFVFMIIGISIVHADSGPTISGNKTVKENEQIALKAFFPNSCLGKNEEGLVCAQNIVDVTSEVAWASSDTTIASVDNGGIVTGVKEGKTIITATYTHSDQETVSSNYEITVTKSNPSEYKNHMVLVLFNEENGQYDEVSNEIWNIGNIGSKIKLIPKLCDISNLKSDNTYDESLCTNIDINYTSSDKTIADIDKNGIITAINNGETTIKVAAKDEITILTEPVIKKIPSVSLKVSVGETEKDKNLVDKIEAPNTASPTSIVAIVISLSLIIIAAVYYFAVINKLKTWKRE